MKIEESILYGLIAMVCWGIYFSFIKIPIGAIGWFWPALISFSTFPLVYVFMKYKKIPLRPISYKGSLVTLLLYVVITTGGDYTYNYAISKSLASIVAPIAGAYPTLYTPLAYFIFRDKITKQQIFGIIITIVGIVALSFLSV